MYQHVDGARATLTPRHRYDAQKHSEHAVVVVSIYRSWTVVQLYNAYLLILIFVSIHFPYQITCVCLSSHTLLETAQMTVGVQAVLTHSYPHVHTVVTEVSASILHVMTTEEPPDRLRGGI